MFYLVKDFEVVIVDSLVEELKVGPQHTQAIPTREGLPGPAISTINNWI